jgi:tetratricopeptide (TPR) repeat protein
MTRIAIVIFSILMGIGATTGCSLSLQRWQFSSAVKLANDGSYKKALDRFSKVVRRSPEQPIAMESARRGARIAEFEIKNYSKAAEFYRHLIIYSPDADERIAAQKSLAEIYFQKLQNYDQAVIEFNRLLPLLPVGERASFKLDLAKATMNLNNLDQALMEINELLAQKVPVKLRFQSLLLKANLLQARKSPKEATAILTNLLEEFPDQARTENISMSLAICHEELGEFSKAIETLEKFKSQYPNPEFIDSRIRQLRARMANQPGAQGIKR